MWFKKNNNSKNVYLLLDRSGSMAYTNAEKAEFENEGAGKDTNSN